MNFRIMRKLLRVLGIVTLISMVLSQSGSAILAEAETAIFSVSGPAQSVKPGEQFTVNIFVQPNTEIAGTQFNLSFNPALVTVNSVTEGNLLKQGGFHTYFSPGVIDNTHGMITGVAGVITDPGYAVSAQGIFAAITFTAGSTEGTCPLTLSKALAGDLNALPVSVNTVNANIVIGDSVNQPPVLNSIGDKSVIAGSALNFSISASDPDGDLLTYSASNLPLGATFDPLSSTFSWATAADQVGSYPNLRFEVTDGTLIDSETIILTLNSPASTTGGGGGGGGGGGAPAAIPTPTAPSVKLNEFNFTQNTNIKSDDELAEVMIDQGTICLLKEGNRFENISVIAGHTAIAAPGQFKILGNVYDLGPDGATFDKPISLTFTYNPSLIPAGTGEDELIIATWNPDLGQWVNLESTVDLINKAITARVNHFSMYAILAPLHPPASTDSQVEEPAPLAADQPAAAKIDEIGQDTNRDSMVIEEPASVDLALSIADDVDGPESKAQLTQTAESVPEFSLSLLAKMTGCALFLILATVFFILLRRHILLKKEKS